MFSTSVSWLFLIELLQIQQDGADEPITAVSNPPCRAKSSTATVAAPATATATTTTAAHPSYFGLPPPPEASDNEDAQAEWVARVVLHLRKGCGSLFWSDRASEVDR